MTEAQVRKYRILDNKLSDIAERDMENIELELKDLNDMELNELFPDIKLEDDLDIENEDNAPEPQKEAKIVEL